MSENLQNWEAFIAVASLSDIGMRRTNNQDNLSISLASNFEQWQRRGHLFIVADGMGAHAAGELASKLAVDHIPHLYGKYDDLTAHEALRKSVIDANTEIHKRGQANEEFHNMGTTCSTLLLLPQGAVVAHVGDSRVYRIRKNRLEQLTFDHSLVWEMRKSGQLSDEELASGKIPKNVITRSLGPYPESKVDLEGPFPIVVDDKFLLCSDGLTGLVTDEELATIIANLPPNEAVKVLVDLANLRGGHDNITCIIAHIKHPQLATTTSGQLMSLSSRGRQKNSINPLQIAILVGSVVTAAIFYFLGQITIAIIPALIFLAALIWILVQVITQSSFDTDPNGVQSLGEGPYVSAVTNSVDQVTEQLKETIDQLVVAARKQEWKIDWEELSKLTDDATKTNGAESIRSYARCISFLMDQIRNQPPDSSN